MAQHLHLTFHQNVALRFRQRRRGQRSLIRKGSGYGGEFNEIGQDFRSSGVGDACKSSRFGATGWRHRE
jgi:hypothetical protein